jgi:hypothetical protein
MINRVLKSVLLLLLWACGAEAQTFNGPLLGVEAGRQHIIGGSLVDEIDTLQEDTRTVVSVSGGYRFEARRFVFGGELGLGWTDGDLALADPSRSLAVTYQNHMQRHWQLHGGYAIGAGTLLFGYVSEITRNFDVTVDSRGQTFTQEDEQGILRFGGGVEQRLRGPFHLRLTAGSARADFGDRRTNIDVNRRFEIAAGLVVQF